MAFIDSQRGDEMNSSVPKICYRINEACHALGIGRTTLYALVRDGKLRLIRIGGRSLVPRSELERFESLD